MAFPSTTPTTTNPTHANTTTATAKKFHHAKMKDLRLRKSSVERFIFSTLCLIVLVRLSSVFFHSESGNGKASVPVLFAKDELVAEGVLVSSISKGGEENGLARSIAGKDANEDDANDSEEDMNTERNSENDFEKQQRKKKSVSSTTTTTTTQNSASTTSKSLSSSSSLSSLSSSSSSRNKQGTQSTTTTTNNNNNNNSQRMKRMEDEIFEILRDKNRALVTNKRLFVVEKSVNPEDERDKRTKQVLQHWLESTASDTNETLIYHFPRSLFEQLPLDEPKFEFKTCAVVGNSGVTLLKEYGDEIDKHDAVIRINMAPIRGFEKYVGKRTTFDVVNSHNVREILQGVRRWRPAMEGETKLVLFETASHFARYHLCQPLLKKYGNENAILLNPLFSNTAHSLWIKLKELLEKTKNSQYNRKPMSGFFAVLYALQMCNKVDLYGFDAYTSRKKSYRYHYFDNVQGFTDVHSFDLAIEVFKFIARKGEAGALTINV